MNKSPTVHSHRCPSCSMKVYTAEKMPEDATSEELLCNTCHHTPDRRFALELDHGQWDRFNSMMIHQMEGLDITEQDWDWLWKTILEPVQVGADIKT